MATTTISTTHEILPTPGVIMKLFITPASANANDTIDVSSHFTNILYCTGWNSTTTGDQVTVTNSAGVLTLDAAGGTTTDVYAVLVIGTLRP